MKSDSLSRKKTEAHRCAHSRSHGFGLFVHLRLREVFRSSRDIELDSKTILCSCCGHGVEVGFFLEVGMEITGLDISSEMLKECRRKYRDWHMSLNLVLGDAERMPFRNNSFDVALVVAGLHHLAHPYEGINELARVSKNVIALIDLVEPLITRIFKHIPLFRKEWLGIEPNRLKLTRMRATLESNGLTIQKIINQFGYLPGVFRALVNESAEKALFKIQQTTFRFIPALVEVSCNEVIVVAYK